MSGLLEDNLESVQEWLESLGDSTHDLLAQLMENPDLMNGLLDQNPGSSNAIFKYFCIINVIMSSFFTLEGHLILVLQKVIFLGGIGQTEFMIFTWPGLYSNLKWNFLWKSSIVSTCSS